MIYATRAAALSPFPLSQAYAELLAHPVRQVAETGPRRPFLYRERHLQCVWFDEKWRPDLISHTGEEVTVESPGRWNLEAGPDFLDSILRVGPEKRRLVGDVEIHVSPTDWRSHGHGGDPLYNHVVAHVTYAAGALPPHELPPGALQISMHDALARCPSFSFDAIDVTAYPYGVAASPTPCSRVLSGRSPDEHLALLRMAGQERLRIKAERAESRIAETGMAQALYEELMTALGYKHNRTPFRELAALVPVCELADVAGRDALKTYAVLLGVSGLLPTDVSSKWDEEARDFVRSLWDAWWHVQSRWQHRHMSRDDWRLAHLRPANHPVRRLMAAAMLVVGSADIEEFLSCRPLDDAKAWYDAAHRLLAAASPIPFWHRRVSLGGKPAPSPVALIGPGRAAAIISNVFIPFLGALGHDMKHLLDGMPVEDDNHLTRETAVALFGCDHNPALYRDGLVQQGLVQIHHDFCLNRMAGCAGCPLPEAFGSAFGRPVN